MPLIDLTFQAPLNVSCQIGDFAYFVDTASQYTTNATHGSLDVHQNTAQPVFIGPIRNVSNARNSAPYDPSTNPNPTITVDSTLPNTLHGRDLFIFFNKTNQVNLSSILGYYADIKFENDSTEYAEIFSVGVDAFDSSK